MAKEVFRKVNLQIEAGKATPAPPVGTAVGPLGINIQDFCQKYNAATQDKLGNVIPVVLTVYTDKTFDFVLKTPPTAELLKKAAKIEKASSKGANEVVATLTQDDIKKIAETKMPDLNAYSLEAAMKQVEGTARNMGISVKGVNDQELAEQEKEAEAEEVKEAEREAELQAMQESSQDTNVETEVITEKKDEEEQ